MGIIIYFKNVLKNKYYYKSIVYRPARFACGFICVGAVCLLFAVRLWPKTVKLLLMSLNYNTYRVLHCSTVVSSVTFMYLPIRNIVSLFI